MTQTKQAQQLAKKKVSDMVWCVKWQTRHGTGRLQDINNVVYVDKNCGGIGWGHDTPGHCRHVRARSAAGALSRALGISLTTARRWLEQGRAVVIEDEEEE